MNNAIIDLNIGELDQVSAGSTGSDLAIWGAAAVRTGMMVAAVQPEIGAAIAAVGATAILVGIVAD